MLRISKLVFVLVFALNQVGTNSPPKIYLTLYYESKCPDSKKFIEEQLQPTISKLYNYLFLKLVPFGKASSIDNGYIDFICQHGPPECAGNMVQSCALDLMQERNDLEKISYVACEMQTEAGTNRDMRCVKRAGLNPDLVRRCISSDKGVVLQLAAEYATSLVRPKFIPTITINGQFKQEVQDYALEDLMGIVCSMLGDVPPCVELYNSRAMQYILY